MIAMLLFALVAMSITSLVIYAYRSATSAVYQTTAHAVIQGYVEQIMALDYAVVITAFEESSMSPPTALPLRAISPSVNPNNSIQIDDPLDFSGQVINKNIVVDLRPNNSGGTTEVLMPMRVSMTATNLQVGTEPRAGLEITISYQYRDPAKRGDGWSSDSVSFVKSSVPIF